MREWQVISRHAGTVLVGQLAVMAFGLADTLVAGRHSAETLAALSVGSAVYVSIFVGLQGILQAQLPVWSELRGAGRHGEVGRSVRQALYLSGASAAVGMAVLLFPAPILRWTEIPPGLQGEVRAYLSVLAAALPAALLFRGFSTLNQALGKPVLVTWVQVGSLAVKVPLSAWFVFGGWGLEGMGVVGCAWATLAVNYMMLALAVALLRFAPLYRPLRIWERIEAPHWPTLRRFAQLGIPTGLSVMVEVTSFTLMALFIARMGTLAAAGHQIAASTAAMLFMMPLSLSIATSARVSYWLGARDEHRARHALGLGFRLALGMACGSALLVGLLHQPLARAFAGANLPLAAQAAALLPWVAGYHVADAVQTVCVFVLRSFGIASGPLVIYCVLLWGVGLGGGYLLAYVGLAGWTVRAPAAFWGAGALALWLTAIAFSALLWRVVRSRPLAA